jgi:perosamine synthetase
MVIPVNEPCLDGNELKYVSECIRDGWVSSSGKYIDRFESAWAEYCGRKYGVCVSNGTTALQSALLALELPKDSEVILPTFTIISCIMAVLYAGLKPVLVDSDSETLTMDVEQIKNKLTTKTKAIMPVHIYGHPVDMDPVLEIANNHGLFVIEDAAEAHGAEYKGKRCGSFGDISCFSFYANKIITTGEGGMVLTDSEKLSNKIKKIINLYLKTGSKRFFHEDLGFNYRITNLQAAVGLAQVENVDSIIKKKIYMGNMYTRLLSGINGIKPLVVKSWAKSVYWMFGILIDHCIDLTAADLAELLSCNGVQTRPFFLGMHEQPVFKKMGIFNGEKYPVSEFASTKGLYLPSGLTLTSENILDVCSYLKEIMHGYA